MGLEVVERPLQGRRILVVEDEFILAEAMTAVLEQAGASVVGPIGWVDSALELVQADGNAIDAAIIDVDLHGEKSYAIVDALATRKVPMVLATGYGHEAIDSRYHMYPRCQKPVNMRALFSVLAGAMNGGA
jgi:DNA-binding NtrC family response regulator